MRGYFLIIFFLAIVFIVVVYGAPSNSEGSDPDSAVIPTSQIPAPILPKCDTAIVAAPDGMVHLVELNSGDII
ncbi:hypothetical protein K7X08_014740 [Anisodus acutangulus]|uniref:Uncharacterized protein n=1 Tax=Anisodus acutangulus TaxID=402998 RepID=A0A9Q1LKT1_9SOLA|nr:hypothetical protein K7X08_014740 [Anisodus acutangulus]